MRFNVLFLGSIMLGGSITRAVPHGVQANGPQLRTYEREGEIRDENDDHGNIDVRVENGLVEVTVRGEWTELHLMRVENTPVWTKKRLTELLTSDKLNLSADIDLSNRVLLPYSGRVEMKSNDHQAATYYCYDVISHQVLLGTYTIKRGAPANLHPDTVGFSRGPERACDAVVSRRKDVQNFINAEEDD